MDTPPSQLHSVVVAQLEKPQGGYRPIGVCSSFYRLWGRLRRKQCDAWEASHDRPYFAAGSWRSPVDPVWRAGVRAELAVGDQRKSVASILWDITKFYENFSHAELAGKCKQLGFEIALVRVALVQYRAPRYITLGGFVCAGLSPSQGIIAGCALATTFVKVYTAIECDHLVLTFPLVRFDIFVDD